jgi:hypothetical protein
MQAKRVSFTVTSRMPTSEVTKQRKGGKEESLDPNNVHMCTIICTGLAEVKEMSQKKANPNDISCGSTA